MMNQSISSFYPTSQKFNINFRLLYIVQWRIQDFPDGGGEASTLRGKGRQPIIWPIFAQNLMEMKKIWSRGGASVPTGVVSFSKEKEMPEIKNVLKR